MRRSLSLLLTLALTLPGAAHGQEDPHMARAMRVLESTPLIDGHNDLPWAIRQSETAPVGHVRVANRRSKAA